MDRQVEEALGDVEAEVWVEVGVRRDVRLCRLSFRNGEILEAAVGVDRSAHARKVRVGADVERDAARTAHSSRAQFQQ